MQLLGDFMSALAPRSSFADRGKSDWNSFPAAIDGHDTPNGRRIHAWLGALRFIRRMSARTAVTPFSLDAESMSLARPAYFFVADTGVIPESDFQRAREAAALDRGKIEFHIHLDAQSSLERESALTDQWLGAHGALG
jgi:hypothetical protein